MALMYHTALKSKFEVSDIEALDSGFGPNFTLFQNDIVADGIHKSMESCDVIYGDPPWPHGFNVFNERAGVSDSRTFDAFAAKLGAEILRLGKPFYMICGITLIKKLPANKGIKPITLNGASAKLVWWFDDFNDDVSTSADVIKVLAKKYNVMGDCFCGYSASLKIFLDNGGKSVIGTDFDGKCITISKGVLNGEYDN